MQLAPITTGTTIGTAVLRDFDPQTNTTKTFTADVHAGRVLRTGVKDIRKTGWELIQLTHADFPSTSKGSSTWGTVGFIRNGDAWDAVELLAPEHEGGPEKVMWVPSEMSELRLAPGIRLDAVWQVSHYGGDYTRMMPPVIPAAR